MILPGGKIIFNFMYQNFHNRKGVLAPNPELWQAVGNGDALHEILNNFYTQVYADKKLAHFFEHFTKQYAIEKQYSFLRSIFTGEKCYFGNHPKKAHNWMVISDELFDYREALMASCLREFGLAEHLIIQWRQMEEVFRSAIVKSDPIATIINGIEQSIDSYTNERLDVSTLCDDCTSELDIGENVSCHTRTGKIYCVNCSPNRDINELKR